MIKKAPYRGQKIAYHIKEKIELEFDIKLVWRGSRSYRQNRFIMCSKTVGATQFCYFSIWLLDYDSFCREKYLLYDIIDFLLLGEVPAKITNFLLCA